MKSVQFFRFFFNLPIVLFTKNFFIKEIEGKENFPRENFILASNHQDYLDIFVSGSICFPRKFHFIGQVDTWHGFRGTLVKTFYFLEGVIPLDRKNEKSKQEAVEKAVEILKKEGVLIIYPEGRRSRTGLVQKGKLGAAKIFLETGVPIVPMGIKKPVGFFGEKPEIKRNIEVKIGKPLYFREELEKATNLEKNSKEYFQLLEEITEKTMKEISNLVT